MHIRTSLLLLAILTALVACGEGENKVTSGTTPTQTSESQKTILEVISQTNCLYGPGADYATSHTLDVGQYFEVLAIDDDIVWIDDDIVWFQINPNAIVEPTPPHRPLNELSPQPDPPGSAFQLRCWVPGNTVRTTGDLTKLPIIRMPILRTITKTNCFFGPDYKYSLVRVLNPDQYYGILGIDDDIVWIDDDIVWFQINPNAMIDPTPPHRPLNQPASAVGSSSGEITVRCWVPDRNIKFSADLCSLPIIPAPELVITPMPQQNCKWNPNTQRCE